MAEATLDSIRADLAGELPLHAAFDGWNVIALERAAAALNVDPAVARLAFPGGAPDMIDAWFGTVDRAMLVRVPAAELAAMKIRRRIEALVEARVDLVGPHVESLRRALAILALPTNLALAARLGWRAADVMWRAAGDTATDYNYYTKRALLAGVYSSTMLVLLGDESAGHADTRAFLARRIANVMQFEQAKARLTGAGTERLSLARFLGRLRYPVR